MFGAVAHDGIRNIIFKIYGKMGAHIGCINGKHVEFILQIRFVLLF